MAMRYYAPFPGGGDQARPRGPYALRIGDAERDAAAADLGEHYAAGRLTLDELNQRLDAVFAAKTWGQLTRLMADLPVTGQPHWNGRPAGLAHPRTRPGAGPYGAWSPADFRYDGYLGMADGPWRAPYPPATGHRSGQLRESPTPADRAGRFAALSLLLLAMLIWLFTALLFARHGFYHSVSPVGHPGSVGHIYPGVYPGGGG
jgi:hypothetical protein